jgi:hypothetical protein
LIGGGGCFFPTAVTVVVANPLAAAARPGAATINASIAADVARNASVLRLDLDILFIKLSFLSSLFIRCRNR